MGASSCISEHINRVSTLVQTIEQRCEVNVVIVTRWRCSVIFLICHIPESSVFLSFRLMHAPYRMHGFTNCLKMNLNVYLCRTTLWLLGFFQNFKKQAFSEKYTIMPLQLKNVFRNLIRISSHYAFSSLRYRILIKTMPCNLMKHIMWFCRTFKNCTTIRRACIAACLR